MLTTTKALTYSPLHSTRSLRKDPVDTIRPGTIRPTPGAGGRGRHRIPRLEVRSAERSRTGFGAGPPPDWPDFAPRTNPEAARRRIPPVGTRDIVEGDIGDHRFGRRTAHPPRAGSGHRLRRSRADRGLPAPAPLRRAAVRSRQPPRRPRAHPRSGRLRTDTVGRQRLHRPQPAHLSAAHPAVRRAGGGHAADGDVDERALRGLRAGVRRREGPARVVRHAGARAAAGLRADAAGRAPVPPGGAAAAGGHASALRRRGRR